MPAADHKDYAATPLWRKLGIGPGCRVLLVDPPDDLDAVLEALVPLPAGVRFLTRPGRELDVIVAFVTEAASLRARFGRLRHAVAIDGRLWVAWPKKASRVPTDVTFELVQSMGLAAGLVDNKTVAVTPVFQGLQFVTRTKDRPAG